MSGKPQEFTDDPETYLARHYRRNHERIVPGSRRAIALRATQPNPAHYKTKLDVKELAKYIFVKGKRIDADSRWAMLIDGRLTPDDITDEELIRGEMMSKKGTFTGKRPPWVPRQFVEAMQRESVKRAQEKWTNNLLLAQEELIKIGMNAEIEAPTRLKALTYIIERSSGKIPDKIEMTAEIKPYEELLQGATLERDILEAEVLEDNEQIEEGVANEWPQAIEE